MERPVWRLRMSSPMARGDFFANQALIYNDLEIAKNSANYYLNSGREPTEIRRKVDELYQNLVKKNRPSPSSEERKISLRKFRTETDRKIGDLTRKNFRTSGTKDLSFYLLCIDAEVTPHAEIIQYSLLKERSIEESLTDSPLRTRLREALRDSSSSGILSSLYEEALREIEIKGGTGLYFLHRSLEEVLQLDPHQEPEKILDSLLKRFSSVLKKIEPSFREYKTLSETDFTPLREALASSSEHRVVYSPETGFTVAEKKTNEEGVRTARVLREIALHLISNDVHILRKFGPVPDSEKNIFLKNTILSLAKAVRLSEEKPSTGLFSFGRKTNIEYKKMTEEFITAIKSLLLTRYHMAMDQVRKEEAGKLPVLDSLFREDPQIEIFFVIAEELQFLSNLTADKYIDALYQARLRAKDRSTLRTKRESLYAPHIMDIKTAPEDKESDAYKIKQKLNEILSLGIKHFHFSLQPLTSLLQWDEEALTSLFNTMEKTPSSSPKPISGEKIHLFKEHLLILRKAEMEALSIFNELGKNLIQDPLYFEIPSEDLSSEDRKALCTIAETVDRYPSLQTPLMLAALKKIKDGREEKVSIETAFLLKMILKLVAVHNKINALEEWDIGFLNSFFHSPRWERYASAVMECNRNQEAFTAFLSRHKLNDLKGSFEKETLLSEELRLKRHYLEPLVSMHLLTPFQLFLKWKDLIGDMAKRTLLQGRLQLALEGIEHGNGAVNSLQTN